MKPSRGEKVFDVFNLLLLTLFALACLYPFLNMVVLAFNSGSDSMRGGITIYPRAFTLANFAAILRDGTIISAYKVTVARTLIGTLSSVMVTALVAYGLSDKRLPGRRGIMVYMLIPMFFSGGLIPYFLTLRALKLINNFWIFVLPGVFNIWNCIVMKTSFQGIPESLKESMRLDGAREFTIFMRIVVPVSLPMFAAISLFVAVGHWNDWFTGAFFIRRNDLIPVQTYLQQIMSRNLSSFLPNEGVIITGSALFDYSKVNSTSMKMAAVVIGTAPILIVYPFLQKYFTKGVLIGSIKE